MNVKRYALVRANDLNPERVAAYLPSNYKIIGTANTYDPISRTCKVLVIEGRDSMGWTLDRYVIPRLASGLMAVEEIDLSHPVMKDIPD